MSATVYAFYEDGELVAVGTARQLSETLGCCLSAVYRYASDGSGARHAVPVSELWARDVFAKRNADAMCEVCARIVRATLGGCRESGAGCEGLGWCLPCFRGALKLAAERGRG